MSGNNRIRLSAASALAALLLAPLAHAAGPGGGGGGGQGGRPAPAPRVITVPTPVPGTNIVVPAGTPIGSVIGFAPAVPGFPAAPITLQPNRTNGRPFGGV
ncbi:hypothetical protein [Ramlibacter sp. AN1133]|uniref:hypothetical protein n=1 Tax=Ramlibacter sp. AN1133 TaxID=3133429 RepID=UPI0030C621CF